MLCQCLARLARRSPGGASLAASRTATVTSTGGNSCWFKRNDSRVRRLMRLRTTAPAQERVAIAKPSRGYVSRLGRTDKLKYASENRLPRCLTSRNSAGWCRRLRGSNVSVRMAGQPGAEASGAEALAALRTSPSKQPPAALGSHPGAKPVGTRTMQVTWIEGTFHSTT